MKRSIKTIFALFLMILLSACGGGGGGGTPVGPSYTGDFAAGNETPGAGTVTLQKGSTSGSIVYIDVVITSVNNVGGAAIKLDYDSSKVHWAGSCEEGDFFSSAGVKLKTIALDAGLEGSLVIGITGNEDVTGSGTLLRIPFRVIATGESAITFSSDSALTDSMAPQYEPVLSYSTSEWIGGTISGI